MIHEKLSKAFEKTRRSLKTALKSRESQSRFQQTPRHQEQKDVVMEFSALISTEATPPGNALNISMERFHVSVEISQ